MAKITKVAVIGAGLMGNGIAQVVAMSGQNVTLTDVSGDILYRARELIHTSLNKFKEKGIIKEETADILGRIEFSSSLGRSVGSADLVIEAVPEDIDLKLKIFSEVERLAPYHTIFATNTSGLSINAMADVTSRPDRFIGMHWMNPPVLMRLIEVIKGTKTSDETLGAIVDLCGQYNKEVAVAKKDVWYFLAARAQTGWHMEAALMALNGEATVEEIDAVARYNFGLPMGPFELSDFTGAADIRVNAIDSVKKILEINPRFEPWPSFLKVFEYLVGVFWRPRRDKGLTGVKTGRGFYVYPGPGRYEKPNIAKTFPDNIKSIKLLATVANTAAWCVTNGVGSVEDVEKCFKLAFGWPKGVFEFVEEYGAESVVNELIEKQVKVPAWMKMFYEPDPLLLKTPSKASNSK